MTARNKMMITVRAEMKLWPEYSAALQEIDMFLSELVKHIESCDNAHECDLMDGFVKRANALGYGKESEREHSTVAG